MPSDLSVAQKSVTWSEHLEHSERIVIQIMADSTSCPQNGDALTIITHQRSVTRSSDSNLALTISCILFTSSSVNERSIDRYVNL